MGGFFRISLVQPSCLRTVYQQPWESGSISFACGVVRKWTIIPANGNFTGDTDNDPSIGIEGALSSDKPVQRRVSGDFSP